MCTCIPHVCIACTQVEALFDELDLNGGGTLDVPEVRKSLRRFQEEAEGVKDQIRQLALAYIAALKKAKRAQAEYRAQLKAEQEQTEFWEHHGEKAQKTYASEKTKRERRVSVESQ